MILELGVGVVLVAGVWLLRRSLGRRANARLDARRFVLRVRNSHEDSVLLGRGKLGDDAIESAALIVVDDADNRIEIPAGLQLTLRDFEVGEWVDDADGRRLMLLPNGPFWILDAPAWTRCAPSDAEGTRALPKRDYTLTTTSPEAAVAAPILGTMADPLWDANLGTLSWLLPPRGAGSTPIVVVSFADPHRDRTQERALIVDGAAQVLADELLRNSDAPVSTAFFIVVDRAVVRRRRVPSWGECRPLLERLEGPHVILRGEALPRLTDGFRVVARWSTEGTERIFDGPLDEVASQLVEYLQGRSACTAMTPSASLRVPATSMLAYQRVASLALDSLLADDRNQATPPVPGQAGSAAEHARQLALAVPSSIVLQHLWASAAIRAYDADELPEEHWNLLLDRSDEQGAPLHRISPLLLHRLDFDGAEERRAELLAGRVQPYRAAPGPYVAWLQALDLRRSDDG